MGSASLPFLGYSLLVVLVFNASRALAWRQGVLLVASLYFLATFAGAWQAFLPLAGFLAFGFISVRALQSARTRRVWPFLVTGVAVFIWLKKYTILPDAGLLHFSYVTIGLSYIFFRVLHLIIDASEEALEKRVELVPYLNYTLNFTTLISGPIQRYQDFGENMLGPAPLPLDTSTVCRSIERIIVGFFKVNVLSVLLFGAHERGLADLTAATPLGDKTVYGVAIVAIYPLYLYCKFSGYIDIVIGVARMLRLELPENFNRPFSSDNFIGFWSRWHVTLSEWLKGYVYNPLLIALMRRFPSQAMEPFLAVFAFFVTFFLIGVWHGRTSEFLVFGLLQGMGVSLNKLYQILLARRIGRGRYRGLSENQIYRALARGLTFTWFTFTLLWFWSNWTQIGTIDRSLGLSGLAAVWLIVFGGATVLLQVYEMLRDLALSIVWDGTPVFTSPYFRTVTDTALLVASFAVVTLMNSAAPDIVYKAF